LVRTTAVNQKTNEWEELNFNKHRKRNGERKSVRDIRKAEILTRRMVRNRRGTEGLNSDKSAQRGETKGKGQGTMNEKGEK
jgi:hypothetical protein